MPWDFKSNQPIIFNPDDSCDCLGKSFCQLIEQGDITSFQFSRSLRGDERITNGSFDSSSSWTLGAGWAISGGEAIHTPGNVAVLQQNSVFESDKEYRVTFKVINRTAGSVQVCSGVCAPYTAEINGDHEVCFDPGGLALQFSPTSDFDGNIDDVSVVELCVYEIRIRQDGTDLTTVPAEMIEEENCNVQVNIDWTTLALDDGCYEICLYGDCCDELAENLADEPGFDAVGDWDDSDPLWSIGAGVASWASLGASSSSMTQALSICDELFYEITYTVNSIGAGTSIRVFLGATAGTSRIDTGTFTEILQANGTTLKFTATSIGAGNVEIDDVVVKVADQSQDRNCSNCFDLRESHDCSLELKSDNVEDAYGFSYANDFQFSVRIAGELWHGRYEVERDIFEDSAGTKKILSASHRKIEELTISQIPAYLHDAISLMLLHDNFFIDGNSYEQAGEYAPNWRRTSTTAPVIVEVEKAAQLRRNYYCETDPCCLLQGSKWEDQCQWCDHVLMFN